MTQSYGLKISLPGYAVESATPEQCSIHSSYNSLKVKEDSSNPQLGNIIVTFKDNPGVGTYPIYSVNHNYGYVPDIYFFFDTQRSTALTSTEVGSIFSLDELNQEYFEVVPTETQMIFQFVVLSALDSPSGQTFSFRYYIFANDGT